MKCGKSRCIFLYGILNLYVALAAPFEKRNIREFMQEPDSKHGTDYEWFPTAEIGKPKNKNWDDEDENASLKKLNAAKEEAMRRTKRTTTTTARTTKKSDSNYKTICEDGTPGNCAFKTGSEEHLSLDELISRMKQVLNHENRMLENDVMELRRLVMKVGEKVEDLKKKCHNCDEHERKDSPVAEIEERHVVERKLIHSKEHHDKEENKNPNLELHMERIPKNDGIKVPQMPAYHQQAPAPPPPQMPVFHKQEPAPPPPSLHQPPKRLHQEVKHIIHTKTQTHAHAAQPQVPTNFLEGVPPDVNYNGGIPKHMDELKKEYPQGYWPVDGAPAPGTGDDNSSNQRNNDDNEEEGKDYEVFNLQEHIDTRKARETPQVVTTENMLSPEYLEGIIRREQIRHQKLKSEKQHHVAEHKLPVND